MTSVERYRDKLESPRNVEEIVIDEDFLNSLIAKAEKDDRKRHLELLHEGDFETSHRMINAMLPETEVTVHMHPSNRLGISKGNKVLLLSCSPKKVTQRREPL